MPKTPHRPVIVGALIFIHFGFIELKIHNGVSEKGILKVVKVRFKLIMPIDL
jgi:hypothetical protein